MHLLWVLVVALIVRLALLDSSARYVMVTGESLLAGCGRLGRWVVLMWFAISVLRRHASALVRLVLLGTAANLVVPLPGPHGVAIWGVISWSAGFVLLYWGRYKAVEKMSKPLVAIMGGCLLAAAILSRPDLGLLLQESLHPMLPPATGHYSTAIVVMAMLASAMGSFSNLRYAAYVHEKGWRTLEHLRSQRADMFVSVLSMFLMLVMIQLAAASALKPQGIVVTEVEDIVPIFGQVLGVWGRVLFGVTLWGVCFAGYAGNNAGYGIMLSDVYYRFIRPSEEVTVKGKAAGDMPAYRWLIIYVFLSPLYVFFTGWTPIGLVLAYGVMSIVTMPVIALIVLRLTADRKAMGEYANGWFTNTVLALAVVCAVYLSWEAGVEVFAQVRGS